ncbi:MAG: HPr family phosphocarrier protein [Pseudomonadota bacterium]
MAQKQLTIINKLGLHARATAKLVTLVSPYKSDILIQLGDKSANAKSMMSVMMLAAAQGCTLSLTITGDDEKECLIAIAELINNRFGEAE